MPGPDDLDDLMNETDFALEDQFRALEQRADLNEVKARMGAHDPAPVTGWGAAADAAAITPAEREGEVVELGPPPTVAATIQPGPASAAADPLAADPLADLKATFVANAKPVPKAAPRVESFVVVCPGCDRRNRVPRARLAALDADDVPRCGACRASLVVLR